MSAARTIPTVVNFGGNRSFQPRAVLAPASEEELIEILRANRGQRIRAIGRLHSWSEVVVGEEIVIEMRHLTRVTVHQTGDESWAEVEAGCSVKQVLTELNQTGFTLPSVGLITAQTLVGAAATGTHGSGRHSLSHYIQSVRVASYDPATGEPHIRVIDSGEELLAARCALGCLGVIISVRIPIRPQYQIEEHIRRYDSLAQVLQQETDYPLQQFFLVPWRWDFFVQQRRELNQPRSSSAWLYRLYWRVGMDVGFHDIILALVRLLPRHCTKLFYRWVMPLLVPQGWKVVDRSDRQLTMQHQLFRHIEIEIFVKSSQLAVAVEYVTWLLKYLGGATAEAPAVIRERLNASGQWPDVEPMRGAYLHHYPVCVRKVLPDETLISMTADTREPCYALSFISYQHPSRRDGFFRFAGVLATTMATLFDARPHWGKFCPLPADELRRLYPKLDQFAAICAESGSLDVFTNNWLQGILVACNTVAAPAPPDS